MSARAEERDRLIAFLAVSVALHALFALTLLEQPWGGATRLPTPEPVQVKIVAAPKPEPAPPQPAPAPPPTPPPPKPKPVAKAAPPAPGRAPAPQPPPEVVEPEAAAERLPSVSAPPPEISEVAVPAEPAAPSAPQVMAAAVAAPQPGPVAEPDFDAYIAAVRKMIDSHKRFPAAARRRGMEGVVTVRIDIADDGNVAGVRTVGNAPRMFERSAIDAVRRAAPFPAPPEGFGDLEVAIRYRLDG